MSASQPDLFAIIGLNNYLQPAKATRRTSQPKTASDKDIFINDIKKQIELVSVWSQKHPTMIDGPTPLTDGTMQQVPKDFPKTSGRGQRETWFRIDKDGRWVLNLFLGNLLIFENPFLIVGGWEGLSKVLNKIKTAAEDGGFDSRLKQVRDDSRKRREATKAAKAKAA